MSENLEAKLKLADEIINLQADRLEELEKACDEWAEVSQSNYQRARVAEAKLAIAVEALEYIKDALSLYSAKEALTKIKGEA